MKKCPEKELLVTDFDSHESAELEAHLLGCGKCRAEVAQIQAIEAAMRKNAEAAYVPGRIRDAAMTEINKAAKVSAPTPKNRTLSWFWIFAPGMAIIFIASLLTTSLNPPSRTISSALVSCQASSKYSTVNNRLIEFGSRVELAHLPIQLSGSFLFSVAATDTCIFELNGQSELIAIADGEIAFRNASATFSLLRGESLEISINSQRRLLASVPVQVGACIGVLPVLPGENRIPEIPKKTETIADPETAPSAAVKKNPEESVVEIPADHVILEEPDIVVPDERPADRPVNPFQDQPIDLNGN